MVAGYPTTWNWSSSTNPNRLSANAIEHLRDQFDRGDHGLLFIGMAGVEKTFSRYPQLYSRVGFAHHYRPLTGEELTFVLSRHWHRLGLQLDGDDFTDAQAIAAVARITGGNFRLLQRLFAQIQRVMKINDFTPLPPTSSKPPAPPSSSAPPSAVKSPPVYCCESHGGVTP
jgi:DNA transposition AAA+ family ATPase